MSTWDRMLGTWEFTMHHAEVEEPITGRQRYERTLDGAFIIQHSHYNRPDFPDAMSMFTEDVCYYFDVRKVVRIFDLEADESGWTMVHLDDAFSQRFTARFSDDNTIDCTGERSGDRGATWQHDFTMVYRRVQDPAR